MGTFGDLSKEKYISLTSYKKNGDAVGVPVWLVPEGDRVYVWTNRQSWKAKRLKNDPRCAIAPCDASGKKILGPAMPGTARFVEGDDAARIAAAVRARYGFQFHLIAAINFMRGIRDYAVIELTPT